MVIKIHQSINTLRALDYNEKKVKEGKAQFYAFANAGCANPFMYDKAFRSSVFTHIEENNTKAKHKCFHMTVNPTISDLEKINDQQLKKEINQLMIQLGYGNQPYFVYKHQDIDRTHFHIVSSRIDKDTFKQIKYSYERLVVQDFIKELKEKYDLVQEKKQQEINLIPTADSRNLKDSIQEVIKILNSSNLNSRQEYEDILKAFNLLIYQTERGLSILIVGQEGETIRHSIKMSELQERANLNFSIESKQKESPELQKVLQDKTKMVLKELIQDYRFFTEKELRKAFLRNNLIPYQISKNGNYNIFSPHDKTVADAQFLIKKYSVRMKTFALSNDQFYAIVRDYTDQLLTNNQTIVDALLDKDKSIINSDSANNKIYLKELDPRSSQEYNNIASKLDKNAQNELKTALKSHFEYLLNRAVNIPQKQQTHEHYQIQNISSMERINRQFLFELMNYWRKGNYQQRYDRRKKKRLNKSKGKKHRKKSIW